MTELIGKLTLDAATTAANSIIAIAAKAFAEQLPASIVQDADIVERALGVLRERLGDADFTPALLAKEVDVSRTQLYELFVPYGGISILQLRLRLDAALKALLFATPEPGIISRIGFAHGFRSEVQFSRAFRLRFGCTAREVLGRATDQGTIYLDWLNAGGAKGESAAKAWVNIEKE